MEIQATDLSARLLATENLTVVRASVPTASFDIKSRVLTLPIWKDMTPEIEDMLVGHEVGHALYTLDKYVTPILENPKMKSYMNILEDVRIEKLIKRKYPGLRRRMNEGYKQLNDKDFFGLSKVASLEDLNLIDRINLYFKAGYQCGVQFNADEKSFVNRAERTETIDEVIDLANDIYKYSKEQAEQKKQQRKSTSSAEDLEDEQDQDVFDDVDDFGDDENYEDENVEENQQKEEDDKTSKGRGDGSDDTEESLESVTERSFANRLEELADQDTEYRYHKIENLPYNVVIGYKRILKELSFDFEDVSISSYYRNRVYGTKSLEQYETKHQKDVLKFKNDSLSSVNYLIKEFEMKKSAQLYKRAQVSKIGSLDMRKVYAYQLQDDLFKRVTTLPQGKNHGMIMLIDWSGSMGDVILDTIKQVIKAYKSQGYFKCRLRRVSLLAITFAF